MTTYEQDKEFAARFTARAKEIGEAMGEGWTLKLAERDDNYPITHADLIAADGMAIFIRQDGGRIAASPSLPKRYNGYTSLRDWGVIEYNAKGPDASVAFDRDAKQIANDIKRKVAEPYAPMFAKIRERQAEVAQGIAKAKAILPVFQNILLRQAYASGGGGISFEDGRGATISAEGMQVEIDAYGNAYLTAKASGEEAIELAKWVMARRKKKPEHSREPELDHSPLIEL